MPCFASQRHGIWQTFTFTSHGAPARYVMCALRGQKLARKKLAHVFPGKCKQAKLYDVTTVSHVLSTKLFTALMYNTITCMYTINCNVFSVDSVGSRLSEN